MKLRVFLLYPFTLLYMMITSFRNHLYNIGYTRSFNYDIMTINVGNLSVGGTGKTPMVEYLIRLLRKQYALATLSRGYKRKSKGIIIASPTSTVHDLGDEPFQYHLNFGDQVFVAVGEERSLAIPKILMEHPETQAILLDDAYQHRTVTPDLNILLTQYSSPFYKDHVLPSGLLREKRSGAKRADIIVVTKCPMNLEEGEKSEITARIKKYAKPEAEVFFSAIRYGIPVALNKTDTFSGNVIVFAGLANMQPMVDYVTNTFELADSISFKDHHHYTIKEVEALVGKAKELNATLLTTEKDIVKLRSKDYLKVVEDVGLFYLPISVQFLFDEGEEFDLLVNEAIIEKYEREEELEPSDEEE